MQVTRLKHIQPGNAAVQQNMILIISIMQPQCPFYISVNTLAVNAGKFHVCRHLQFQHGLLYSACKNTVFLWTVQAIMCHRTLVRHDLSS